MSKTVLYPRSALLNSWTSHNWKNGLQVESLGDFTEIQVQTRNTLYEITVIDGFRREILVRGGRFFPEKTRASLAGSSLGGGLLKLGGIYTGFSLEIVSDDETIITTHVKSIHCMKHGRGLHG
jgi:hypothetical protein